MTVMAGKTQKEHLLLDGSEGFSEDLAAELKVHVETEYCAFDCWDSIHLDCIVHVSDCKEIPFENLCAVLVSDYHNLEEWS